MTQRSKTRQCLVRFPYTQKDRERDRESRFHIKLSEELKNQAVQHNILHSHAQDVALNLQEGLEKLLEGSRCPIDHI